jgi:hypothetical protein
MIWKLWQQPNTVHPRVLQSKKFGTVEIRCTQLDEPFRFSRNHLLHPALPKAPDSLTIEFSISGKQLYFMEN